MTSEWKITLIKRTVYLLVFLAIVAGVWLYKPTKKSTPENIAKPSTGDVISKLAPDNQATDDMSVEGSVMMTAHSGVPNDSTVEEIDKLLKKIVSPSKGVAIVHCHLPANPASEQLADVLRAIQQKYGKLVKVVRVEFPAQPADWQAQKGISLPYVMMVVGHENAFQFQGLWSRPKIEKKIEELIFGVRSVGKDWRPAVPGMSHKNR
jgi:hypothetical protein